MSKTEQDSENTVGENLENQISATSVATTTTNSVNSSTSTVIENANLLAKIQLQQQMLSQMSQPAVAVPPAGLGVGISPWVSPIVYPSALGSMSVGKFPTPQNVNRTRIHNALGSNREAQQFLSKGAQVIIRMRGLPYDATAKQVVSKQYAFCQRPCRF